MITNKGLSEIDKVYATINHQITLQERIKYCVSLIYRTQGYMSRNWDNMSNHIKETSYEIVSAAHLEVKLLSEKMKNSPSD